jgi:hypothetical protein
MVKELCSQRKHEPNSFACKRALKQSKDALPRVATTRKKAGFRAASRSATRLFAGAIDTEKLSARQVAEIVEQLCHE